MRFLISILLLVCLVSSQAGILTLERCLCSNSAKHRAACCCGAESQVEGSCCKQTEKQDVSDPSGSSVAIENAKSAGSSCLCVKASGDQPEPAPAEVQVENLIAIPSISESVVLIKPLPQPPSIHAATYSEKLKPPASPQRIQYCSFQL
ncbi:MAG: hypothetical protein ACI9R3_005788 [Verrucomicrobiales bacterium]|jgi:hypothetical protein